MNKELARIIREKEQAFQLLRAALDEMNPRCLYCVHMKESARAGQCMKPCKWEHEDYARKLLGGGNGDS